jgi:16S rRNA (cytosine967-C5)-methyltransferase
VTAEPPRGGARPARPASGPSPARAVAARVLERVETDGAFADLALDAELRRGHPLATRDVALATELVFGTLRWQRYLDWILAPHSRRRLPTLDPRVRVLLRVAAYQIAFLERVPAFAAVHDAVTLARGAPGVAEYVNAVLRAFSRRGAAEREPTLPRDPLEALATRASFPTWLAARWVARYGPAEAEALMRASNARPPLTVRANTLRTSREALAARLRDEERAHVRATSLVPEGLIVEAGGEPGRWRAFADGLCVLQDEASMLVARLLEPTAGSIVADVCAAPGTKTTHLAQLMADRGRVVAFDPQPARLARVIEATARLGVTIVQAVDGTVETLAPRWAAACDGVLVDAPCSNLGVLRRNPEVKWRRQPGDVLAAAVRQGAILTAAATLVRPGGRLVYATCSLEPEENDDVVSHFLAVRRDFAVESMAGVAVAPDAGGFVRCLPHRDGTDGFTAIRLRRR